LKPIQKQRSELRHQEELKKAILEYLSEHPNAMDTMVGIADWWLMRNQVRVQISLLDKVLRQMTASNFLEAQGTGGQKLYRLKAPTDSHKSTVRERGSGRKSN